MLMTSFGLSVCSLFVASGARGNVRVEQCAIDTSCTCIEWWDGANSTVEMRCPGSSGGGSGSSGGGWVSTGGGIPDNDGSFGGGGAIKPPAATPPGGELPPQGPQDTKVKQAKTKVTEKLALKCHKDPRTQQNRCWDTTCTQLFHNNKTNLPGRNIETKVQYRLGQNYSTVVNGRVVFPCQDPLLPAMAFVDRTRGYHDPYIFLCNSFFALADPSDAALILIHEILHTAGQDENRTNSAGPGDPPSSDSISDVVYNSCVTPREVGNGY